ncbi:MAG: hypothetical protein U0936_25125 [Planctomycetaceae bacterium]
MQGWANAAGGHLNFIRNTTAPASQIINIGTGDLSALGYSSGTKKTMGLGGGTYANVNGQLTISTGVVWMDQAESWDLVYGNGNPIGTYDYYTIVSQEIGHALGVKQTGASPNGADTTVTAGGSEVFLFQSHCGCGGLPVNAIRYNSERTSLSDNDRSLVQAIYGETATDHSSSESDGFFNGTNAGYNWRDQDLRRPVLSTCSTTSVL